MIAVVDYGVANLPNIARALRRAGAADVRITRDAAEIERAEAVVLPGVGNFGHCARELRRFGLEAPLRRGRAAGVALLGLCVGMQLFFEASEEDADARGLGFYRGAVRRLPEGARVPHIGWNAVHIALPHPWLAGVPEGAHFYFVHSYAPDPQDDVVLGTAEHGGASFPAIVGGEGLLGVQFHPEKSGAMGARFLAAFVGAVSR